MAGRFTVEGVFTAVDRMSRPIRRIESRMGRFSRNVQRDFEGIRRASRHVRNGVVAIGAAAALAAAAAAAGLRDVIETGRDFEQSMAQAAARFGTERGTEEFNLLEDAARGVGRGTQYLAQQGAEALSELGAAGLDTRDAIASLQTVTDFATASGMELGESGEIVTDVLNGMGLASEDAAERTRNLAHVSDVLARGANSSSQSIEQYAGSFRNAMVGATQARQTIETLGGALGVMADAGEKGERAGSRLNAMFTDLSNVSGPLDRRLRRMGISVRDATTGQMRDAVDIVSDFEGAISGMDDAARDDLLGRVFGQQGARAMGTLLARGSQSFGELRDNLVNADGAAAAMAETMRDTVGGDMATFGSTVEALKLDIYDMVRGPLRQVVQGMTAWLRANQGWISSGFQDVVRGLGTAFEWVSANMPAIVRWGRRIGIVFGVITAAILLTAAVVTALAWWLGVVVVALAAALVGLVEWLVEAGSGVADAVMGALRGMWSSVVAFFTAAQEFVVGVFVLIGRAVRPYLQPVIDFFAHVARTIASLWRPVGAFFSRLWSGIAKHARAGFNRLLSMASSIASALRTAWAPIGAFFANLWNSIAEGFRSTVGGVVDSVSQFISNVRSEGRDSLDGEAGAAAPRPQMVAPGARAAREIHENTTTAYAEVTIRDETPTERAEVTRRPRGGGLRVVRSGVD